MLLEETESSTSPVRVSEPHFEVFPEFKRPMHNATNYFASVLLESGFMTLHA